MIYPQLFNNQKTHKTEYVSDNISNKNLDEINYQNFSNNILEALIKFDKLDQSSFLLKNDLINKEEYLKNKNKYIINFFLRTNKSYEYKQKCVELCKFFLKIKSISYIENFIKNTIQEIKNKNIPFIKKMTKKTQILIDNDLKKDEIKKEDALTEKKE